MDLIFLRRLTLEQLPLRLAQTFEVDAFEALRRAQLVDGHIETVEGRPQAVVASVTPHGRAYLARGRVKTLLGRRS